MSPHEVWILYNGGTFVTGAQLCESDVGYSGSSLGQPRARGRSACILTRTEAASEGFKDPRLLLKAVDNANGYDIPAIEL
jgi:hypothetical protein